MHKPVSRRLAAGLAIGLLAASATVAKEESKIRLRMEKLAGGNERGKLSSHLSPGSAQLSVHVAMACGADQVLAKPGMGADVGLSIVRNEMARVMALAG